MTWAVDNGEDLDIAVEDLVSKLVRAPHETVLMSKQSLLFMADKHGERDVNRFHFIAHQLSHWPQESQDVLAERMDRLARANPRFLTLSVAAIEAADHRFGWSEPRTAVSRLRPPD